MIIGPPPKFYETRDNLTKRRTVPLASRSSATMAAMLLPWALSA